MAIQITKEEMNQCTDVLSSGNTLSFMTVTLPPRFYKFTSITQYELTKNELCRLLEAGTDWAWCVVELTREGNVHYHIIASTHYKHQIIGFINKVKRSKSFGYVKLSPDIQTPESLTRSINYLCKDLESSRKVLHTSAYRPDLLFKVY